MEKLYLCWKPALEGTMPCHLPTKRTYVDAGYYSSLDEMKKVLVLARQDHALVSKEVRDVTLQYMDSANVGLLRHANRLAIVAMRCQKRMSLKQRRTDVSTAM